MCIRDRRSVTGRPGTRAIILIYSAVACTAGIATMGMVQFLITTLLAPFYFATPENRWEEFWAHVPQWAAPRSPKLVEGFFLGGSSLYDPAIWKAWLGPAAAWSVFLAALLGAQYGIALRMYLDDNSYEFPDAWTWLKSEGHDWVRKGERPEGVLWPYLKALDVHMCPKFNMLAKGTDYADTAVSYVMNSYGGRAVKSGRVGWAPV